MFEIIFLLLICLVIWGIVIYNRLVRDKNRVHEGWSDIDVQLKLRHNLIPNLVMITQQYAKYEQAALSTITELRSQSDKVIHVDEKGQIEAQLESGLQKLVALVEQYPDLKANQNIIKLQHELVAIEEQVQYARRYYNGAVRNFNTCIERFPNLIIARTFAFKQSKFFQLEADERILSFHSDIQISIDGSMQVKETILVRAENNKIKRGIYRDFPTHYKDRLSLE